MIAGWGDCFVFPTVCVSRLFFAVVWMSVGAVLVGWWFWVILDDFFVVPFPFI